ncbi:aspartate aminotransferase [Candidatus Woesearchaeota archaeon]|nr:aspartate aminotransferase [Candidatus Woesearchaeota archaeon]|tara:strand:+ start:4749 stop:5927 length:1179 start_codon:yes stop_codon:yes gene_type:complete
MKIKYAQRVNRIPKYLFVWIEDLIQEEEKKGTDLIRLGVGIPDLPTPKFIIKKLVEEIQKPKHHFYSIVCSPGEDFFRQSVAQWHKNRFNVKLDAETETCNLVGAKEGLVNLSRAFVNPGDYVLAPDPGYPVYANGAGILNDASVHYMPLSAENNFLPVFDKIPQEIRKKAKIMYLNYPNNPTAAVIDKKFIKEALDFAEDNDIIICYDNAYSEMYFDDYVSPSLLEFDRGMNHIELNSFSKTFAMAGDRIGMAAGNKDIIAGMIKVKSQLDMGCPMYIQAAAAAALDSYKGKQRPKEIEEMMKVYESRRDVVVNGLREMGFDCPIPKATFYVWWNCKGDGAEFVTKMIKNGVTLTPGVGFGEHSKEFVRLSLIQPEDRLQEAINRMKEALK